MIIKLNLLLKSITSHHPDLDTAKALLYDKLNLHLTDFKPEPESTEYAAGTFTLSGLKIIFRTSKITPTKTGQFVTLWKRNAEGVTQPYDVSDDFDVVVISARSGEHLGQFVFPKSVLASQGVLSANGKGGKRGFRVYPVWDKVLNKQAEKSQLWQTEYFVMIGSDVIDSKVLDILGGKN